MKFLELRLFFEACSYKIAHLEQPNYLKIYTWISLLFVTIFFNSCNSEPVDDVNIGFIAPLSKRAIDLGIDPANAIKLAIEQYNTSRTPDEPKVNIFIEDDQWEKEKALPAYKKLKSEHDIDILFISNTDGTIAIQDQILKDKVIAINPLNNDALLSTLNKNTFKIAKTTEQANGLMALRIIELGLKKVLILHYPNDFMTRASNAAKLLLDDAGIQNTIITTTIGNVDYHEDLLKYKKDNYDAYVFFGYKEYGFAMKQARDLGITAPFFGSTVLLDPEFYTNSEGEIVGTECSFFTAEDGNYVKAIKFLEDYNTAYNEVPYSVWPALQAYDAINLVLKEVRTIKNSKKPEEEFQNWFRKRLFNVKHFEGTCGNISITKDGSSRGIYFSLYRYESKGVLVKVVK
tara:strand:+ start:122239 stop:123447 length:1209 start_codon:yes stop_codon:yes gene_type:complete